MLRVSTLTIICCWFLNSYFDIAFMFAGEPLASESGVSSDPSVGGTSQAAAGFLDSDIFQRAIKMALRCSLSTNSHISGFKL